MQQAEKSHRKPRHSTPPTDSTGKLPPRDLEAEQAVLGALMLEKDAYMEVCEILVPESFYDPAHQKIYQAITTLSLNQRPIDFVMVTEQLRKDGTLDEVGGPVYITDLSSRVFSAAHVAEHAKIVAQKYLGRRLIGFASNVEGKAFDPVNDIDDLLQEAEGQLFEISQTQLKQEVTHIDPVLREALKEMQLASTSATGISGLQTGYHELDKMTSGWQKGDLVIIAARPAMGKTAFVLSMAKNMAIDFSIPVAFFTLEMPNVQLSKRIISNVANLNGEKIKSGRLEQHEWDRVYKEINTIYGSPLYLDETPGLSVTQLRTKARRLVREHGVKIIIIDYLQLMNASGMKFGSREQEVSTISRSLKALAKELGIPIIALSQLNRSTETREDKRPVLSDLRESGAIEQDADIVCFIHREEYYTKSGFDSEGNDIRGQADLIVAKHRSGAVGDIKLRFVKNFAKFENWDANYDAVQEAITEAGSGPKIYESKMNRKVEESEGDPGFSFDAGGIGTSGFNSPAPDIMPDPGDNEIPF